MHSTSTEYKQMHNKTISWNDNWILIFICFMGRLLLSASSSSSFTTASFLIQMLRWIRVLQELSSSYSSSLDGSSLKGESLIFSCSHILFSYYESSFFLCVLFPESAETNHFLLENIPCINESHDQGGYHHLCILHFFFYRFKLFFYLRDPCKVWLHGLCIPDLHILQLVS